MLNPRQVISRLPTFMFHVNQLAMKTYTIGIIGYGGFGRFLRHWWDKLENVKVVAVSDTNPVDSIKEGVLHYGNWQGLVDDAGIDIVSIATPPGLHVEIACAAMRKGKHIILEKPIALTREGSLQILQAQKETGMVVTVDHMLRYNPIVKALMELSNSDIFGKLRHAEVANYAQDEGLPKTHWFWDKKSSGGIFVEHGVHFFDIINAMTKQNVLKVTGTSHYRNPQQEDQVAASVQYDQGLIASHYHAFSGPGFFEQTTIRLTYDLARIEVRGWIPMEGSIKALITKDSLEKLKVLPGLEIQEKSAIADSIDVSRPEGWGNTDSEISGSVYSSGIHYEADEMVTAKFHTTGTKSEVYGACLQDILLDVIAKIEDNSHTLCINTEDAGKALEIALLADESANN